MLKAQFQKAIDMNMEQNKQTKLQISATRQDAKSMDAILVYFKGYADRLVRPLVCTDPISQ